MKISKITGKIAKKGNKTREKSKSEFRPPAGKLTGVGGFFGKIWSKFGNFLAFKLVFLPTYVEPTKIFEILENCLVRTVKTAVRHEQFSLRNFKNFPGVKTSSW